MNTHAAAAAPEREYEFTDTDFRKVRDLVRRVIGISLSESKRELVYGRLVRRLRQLGLVSFTAYLERLEAGDAAELENFCNAITTNLTSFFRERHHFDELARSILPALAQAKAATRRIRIWSAGCSTGEEPYSIAMTVRETLGELAGWDLRILATDVDSNVLAHAAAGIYEPGRFERVEGARRDRGFAQVAGGRYEARAELRRLISFKRLNLIESWPMRGPFDVIFCRNVIIYFDKDTQRDIIGRMALLQNPGDHLILGHSESLLNVTDKYALTGQTIHKRVGA
ncbi:MAG: protein-glutamate O-methyltransferase CheR [Steroidobacteraceae bacterium]